jgi:hypothetical protein
MTAVVGILNKQAIAIAADSAVTISGGRNRKIFNSANKIFTLSKHHPVGLMIYNSANFMGIPWETLIKVYRKHLGTKEFSTVSDYKNDFVEFLRANNFYSTRDNQLDYIGRVFFNICLSILEKSKEEVFQKLGLIDNDKVLKEFELKLTSFISNLNTFESCLEFSDLKKAEFLKELESVIDNIMKGLFAKNGITPSKKTKSLLSDLFFKITQKQEPITNYTGLIFCGFGAQEIFPSLIAVNVSFALGERLKYFVDNENAAKVSNENGESSFIRPFAQKDVIDTILSGIDPFLNRVYHENFKRFFEKYNDAIVKILEPENKTLAQQIQQIDTNQLLHEYAKMNMETRQTNIIKPLMNAVSNLSKEDLAEMAESLIYLTYLKRRFTFAEESVGGPVDVAIISKGDGFIWMKRKHYFNPELNQHFHGNYFNT